MQEKDSDDVEFPLEALSRLDNMINKPRWIIPVLPNGELEVLLEASIELCKRGEPGIEWLQIYVLDIPY